MSVSVTMPRLGESVSEGTVTRWLKKEGDRVETDEPLLEVSTDKVDTEIPSPASGVLTAIRVSEDETVEVGAELAVIEDGGAGAPSGQQTQERAPAEGQAPDQAQAPAQPGGGTGTVPPPPAPQQPQPQAWAPRQEEQPQPYAPPAQPEAAPEPEPAGGGGEAGGAGGEAVSVVLPALGESVTEGTVTRWLKQEGEQVQADEPLLEVSTDKVDTEIPSPASGVLSAIRVREDETVAVGTELAVISGGAQGGQAPAPQAQQAPAPQARQAPQAQQAPQQAPAPPAQPAPAPQQFPGQRAPAPAQQPQPQADQPVAPAPTPAPAADAEPAAPGEGDGSAYVTPLVRKLAAEHDVDLSSVTGTGVGGRIRKQDVLEAAKAQEAERARRAQEQEAQQSAPAAPQAPARPQTAAVASPLRGGTEKMSRLRATIARRMVESLQVSAQLTTVVEADVTYIARLRDRAKRDFEAREGVKLSFLPFFALATIEALKQHPVVNASIDTEAGTITYHDAEHLGVAVDTDRGLLVPVIHNAGDLNLGGIARKIADLAQRTRLNQVSPDELGGGTFTLTNTGSRGALFDTPIINQPQVGILGTGAVVKRPVVITHPELGETIAIRATAYLALSYDHRLVDGADAARFLTTVKNRLEEGRFEAELGLA
jgi:pyruvate dehydrogenase E2 component (dihydrolipoamide acetyltransferase)